MRLSREAKAQHHEEITSAASKMLRARGIERTSLMDLMQAAGLTHGGFYRHFKSKDELVASAAVKTFEEVVGRMEKSAAESGPKAALIGYIIDYLSDEHRDDPTLGCMVSACGSDAPRQDPAVRDAFGDGIKTILAHVQDGLSCPKSKRADRTMELGALMLGALVMSRATNDRAFSKAILANARRRALEIVDQKT